MSHVARLLRLAQILEELPTTQAFSLRDFAAFRNEKGRASHYRAALGHPASACGTVACACGYAALDPELMAQGLSMQVHDGAWRRVESLEDFNALADNPVNVNLGIEFKGDYANSAAMLFFEIDNEAFKELFMPEGYDTPPSPKEVAEKIREFCS